MALPKARKPGQVQLSTLALATIGLFDLVTTMMWLNHGYAEGNPLFQRIADQGGFALAFAKVCFLAGPIIILEIARKYRPRTAELGTWVAAIGYAYLYGSHLLSLRS